MDCRALKKTTHSNPIFSLLWREIRDHILYAALCNCNLVELLKMEHCESCQISKLKQQPSFSPQIHVKYEMNGSEQRSDYHLSLHDHLRHHALTRCFLRQCLLCAITHTHTHTHTHSRRALNVTTCIIDRRSQLQQTPTVIKKRLLCFISLSASLISSFA